MAIIALALATFFMVIFGLYAVEPNSGHDKTIKKCTRLFYLALTMFIIAGISLVILTSLSMESKVLSRTPIPVHDVQNFTLNYANNTYVFLDNYGNCFVVSKDQAIINTFPDDELRLFSISKVKIMKSVPDIRKFFTDFGIFKKPIIEEKYEFFIPESSLKESNKDYFVIVEALSEGSNSEKD